METFSNKESSSRLPANLTVSDQLSPGPGQALRSDLSARRRSGIWSLDPVSATHHFMLQRARGNVLVSSKPIAPRSIGMD